MRIVLVLVACVAAGLAGASAPTSGAFVNQPLSVRQAGMGGIGEGAGDVLCAWSNPAVLGFQESRGAVGLGGASLFAGDQTTFGLAASWMVLPGVALAGLVSGYSSDTKVIDETGEPAGTSIGRSVWAGGLAFAFRAADPLAAGLTVKTVSDRAGDGSASAAGVDAGIEALVDGIRAGLSVRNAGGPALTGSDPVVRPDHLASETRLGASWTGARNRLTCGAGYSKVDGRDGRIGCGVQWWPAETFAVRAGFSGLQPGQLQVTLGLSAVFSGMGVDYAYASHLLGGSHRVALSYLFGAALQPERPKTAASGAVPLDLKPAASKAPVAPALPPSPKAPPKVPAATPKPLAPMSAAEVDAEYAAAKAANKAGRYAEAKTRLEAVVARDPGNWKCWGLLGNAYYGLKDKPAALAAYGKCLELNPSNPDLQKWVERIRKE